MFAHKLTMKPSDAPARRQPSKPLHPDHRSSPGSSKTHLTVARTNCSLEQNFSPSAKITRHKSHRYSVDKRMCQNTGAQIMAQNEQYSHSAAGDGD